MRSLSCICCVATALLMGVATPAYSNGSKCAFDPSAAPGALTFGNLDPSVAAPMTASVTVMAGDCVNQTMQVTVDQGLRGNRTMQRVGGTELIPYSVTAPSFFPGNSSSTGNSNYKPASFAATVQASAYQDAVAGDYSDQLVVTVTP
jgi:spore coat protein U-like protein